MLHRWLLCSMLLAASPAGAAPHLVLQRTALAGFTHHAAATLWPQLHEGDTLTLEREAANPHDNLAVRILWQGQPLGYLPRTDNGALARALDAGIRLEARISRLREHPDPRRRIEIEVSADLAARP